MDCHSNETTWPWYSRIAPVSWLVYYDTVRGRSQLNISTQGSSTGQDFASRFNQPTDLAYRLGQILAGENRSGGPGEGRFPPPNFTGQPPTGEGSQGGQQLPSRGFPAGGFSGNRVLERISEVINSGQMPPAKYTLIHPSAKLTADETQQLLQGLQATFGSTSP